MSLDNEKKETLERESGVVLSRYVKERVPKAFSGGKVKFREYATLVEDMSSLIDKTEANIEIESTCRKGCAACCSHSILVNGFEVEVILNYIERNYDYETRKAIKQRINDTANRLDATLGPAPRNTNELKNILEHEEEIKTNYFELQLPCPLLNEQQECMVYPVRPSPCWTYRSYGDPDVCNTTFDVPHTINYIGHEEYYSVVKAKSIDAGTITNRKSYVLAGFLPQKLRDAIF
ncbi:YkgJ family cysteine cluster protein [Paenibacillus alvei]|uniref:YkgJ family cysteine cluster protein n=2 Tax=Paenibacillus alvei TaxID=44250 RepID=UPI002282BFE1|nr:YkgJ family cysteine cluster protein [Paenibacillus alvei]MCY9708336.1 YkgJ family cysteine cluster protein [Paenibacillus alvei]MCY9732976.1 YkgJ family cysteine cluster protein [Paenibacillus alvei]MCY9755258.1 YkgJ family cysteine cluster protein [Paenibacillus alvei]MEC0080264.1 YkgJ family cysteine cluster protein [Paenibacillus alvei]